MNLTQEQQNYVGAYEHWLRTEGDPLRWESTTDHRAASIGLDNAKRVLGYSYDFEPLNTIARDRIAREESLNGRR